MKGATKDTKDTKESTKKGLSWEAGRMVDDATKQRIDRWIQEKDLNPYGDPKDTVYSGGTPLFDERTGRVRDRYEYILEKHPELRKG